MNESILAKEFTKRIAQLGLSRRELVRRTGLSRQTLHNVEREGRTHLQPATLRALDKALLWPAGTALALANGDANALHNVDEDSTQREAAYRWRIVERVQRMSLAELERMIAALDGYTEVNATEELMEQVEARILERLRQEQTREPVSTNNGGL